MRGTLEDAGRDVAAETDAFASLALDAERAQIAARNAATRRDYPRDACVHHLFARQAAVAPTALAVAAPDATLTYGQLDAGANRLANRLRTLGVGPEVVVGLCLERSAAMVTAALGILKSGGAYLALDPSHPAPRLAFMLQDAKAPVLVTSLAHAARIDAGTAHVVALDDPGTGLSAEPATTPAQASGVADLAYVIYTSGSTGAPKGVMVEHQSLLNLVFWHRRAFAVTAADRATQLASPAFDAAVWELWPYLTAGASIHVPTEETRAEAEALRDWLLAQRVTVSFAPTPLAEALMAARWPAGTDLRVMLTGGDALHHHPSPDLPFTLVNNYGPTEGTVVATSGTVRPNASARLAPSIGRPIDNVRAYIVDPDMGLSRIGHAGELLVGGALLARGYLGQAGLTEEKFVPDPFSGEEGARLYRTGDRVRYRPDGEIEFLGRVDQQVKIRGYRIEPGEIAATLDAHPDVRSSVVVAREDAPGDRRLVAYAVPANGSRPGPDELRSHLSRSLPDHMVPAAFVWLDELPLTPNGKVDRAALPAPDAANTGREAGRGDAPQTELEVALAAIVCELLGLEAVGSGENFFVLGGHSLLGAQLIARTRDRFGVELALRSLFDNPTVAEMAAEVERLLVEQLEAMSDDEAERLAAEPAPDLVAGAA
ncbi:MAG: non-ribosomal peptide synthetase [Candidatus Dormibacteraeota bacterium]|nr:non-ribosomal peptide synthetase [Candidatus Dormibacteraeota bacterium]